MNIEMQEQVLRMAYGYLLKRILYLEIADIPEEHFFPGAVFLGEIHDNLSSLADKIFANDSDGLKMAQAWMTCYEAWCDARLELVK